MELNDHIDTTIIMFEIIEAEYNQLYSDKRTTIYLNAFYLNLHVIRQYCPVGKWQVSLS